MKTPCPQSLSTKVLPSIYVVFFVSSLMCLLCSAVPDVSDPCASAATQQHEGDIAYFPSAEDLANLLAGSLDSNSSAAQARRKRAATSDTGLLWPLGDIYYSFSSQFTAPEEQQVIDGMRHWEEHTCLRFHRRTTEYTYVNFFQGSGCCAYIGFLGYGRQGISLAKRCLQFPTIVHEIGHAIGFWHEHTRPDRDEYVDVLYDNIDDRYLRNFDKRDPSEVDSHGVGYDYNSVMHYNRNFFAIYQGLDTLHAREANIPIGLAVALSPMDIEQTNRLYFNECGHMMTRPSTLPPPILTTPPPLPYPCGTVISDTVNVSFSSPGHPAAYPASTDCAWLVQPHGNFLIYLDFKNISLESSYSCTKDYIQVFEGRDEGGIHRLLVCGEHESYPSIVVGTGEVFVRFHSDEDLQLGGFYAAVRFSDLNECVGGAGCSHYCQNTYGGYECHCQNGYYLSADSHTCFDINECGVSNGGCKDVCVNTGGSYHCACKTGYVLQPDNISCRPPGSSCSVHNGGCHHNCTETTDSRICSCLSGYNLQPDGVTCFDINECYYYHGCSYKCVNTLGSYHCVCREGHHLTSDNHTCVPERVCGINNGGCNQNCLDGRGGSAVCYCNKGYRLGEDQLTCEDINECAERRRLCDQVCVNTNGSYRCDCHAGYTLDFDLRNCLNVDECQLGIDECQFSTFCQDTYGSYSCGCPSGYYVGNDRHQCHDIDECEMGYQYLCSHGCVNHPGTYECTCEEGYVLQSLWLCLDEDECTTGTHQCDAYSEAGCRNTVGSYVCECPHGLRLDSTGWRCEDIDECSEGLHSCAIGLYCVNVVGYYTCETTPPPTPTPTVSLGGDITTSPPTETELASATTEPAETESSTATTRSSFSATAFSTLLYSTEPQSITKQQSHSGTNLGPTVDDLGPGNGIELAASCAEMECDHTCTMVSKGEAVFAECSCGSGYTLEEDNKSCTDINECEDGANGSCSHICTNSLGSFSCNCPLLHYLAVDGLTCIFYGPSPITSHTTGVFHSTEAPTTDARVSATEDAATTTAEPPTEYRCGGLIANDVGSFHSEHWPMTYPVNVDCEWTITLPNPKLVLQISFDDDPFGLAGKMPKCRRKDWVKVYSMSDNETVVSTWGPFCNYATPPTILTTTSIARVQFHSGSRHGNSRKGFRLRYEALETCIPAPPPLNVQGTFECNSVIQVNEAFGPPEFPDFITQQTSQSCRWIYYGGPSAHLRLLYFDLPQSKDCSDNRLSLFRGITVSESQLLMAPMCGHMTAERRLIQVNTTYFTIELYLSTRDARFRGFHGIMELT